MSDGFVKSYQTWCCGWRWHPRDWRLWYWNIYYDGNHRVLQIGPLQIEYYS